MWIIQYCTTLNYNTNINNISTDQLCGDVAGCRPKCCHHSQTSNVQSNTPLNPFYIWCNMLLTGCTIPLYSAFSAVKSERSFDQFEFIQFIVRGFHTVTGLFPAWCFPHQVSSTPVFSPPVFSPLVWIFLIFKNFKKKKFQKKKFCFVFLQLRCFGASSLRSRQD